MAAVLAAVATMPPMETLPPPVAREIFRQQSAVPPGTPEVPVREVRELAARGAGGPIPIRFYRPLSAQGLVPLELDSLRIAPGKENHVRLEKERLFILQHDTLTIFRR